jgi:hypothetical protein
MLGLSSVGYWLMRLWLGGCGGMATRVEWHLYMYGRPARGRCKCAHVSKSMVLTANMVAAMQLHGSFSAFRSATAQGGLKRASCQGAIRCL